MPASRDFRGSKRRPDSEPLLLLPASPAGELARKLPVLLALLSSEDEQARLDPALVDFSY
jgi:hypothetical protein